MITPADIQNKEFTKGFRGYDEEEVDMFLDLITLDLEKLMKENLNLKAQIATLKKDQDSIGGSDLTVKETLETAKRIMDDLAVSSEKRAKVLVENAEMDAAIIIKDAKMKAEQVAAESSQLTRLPLKLNCSKTSFKICKKIPPHRGCCPFHNFNIYTCFCKPFLVN